MNRKSKEISLSYLVDDIVIKNNGITVIEAVRGQLFLSMSLHGVINNLAYSYTSNGKERLLCFKISNLSFI